MQMNMNIVHSPIASMGYTVYKTHVQHHDKLLFQFKCDFGLFFVSSCVWASSLTPVTSLIALSPPELEVQQRASVRMWADKSQKVDG